MSRRNRHNIEPVDSRVITIKDPADMPDDEVILSALDGKCTINLGTSFTLSKGSKRERSDFQFAIEYGFLPAEASDSAMAAYFLTCIRDNLCLIRAVRDEDECPGCESSECPHFGMEISPPPGTTFRVPLLQAMSAVLFDYTDVQFLSPTGVRADDVSLEDAKEITAGLRLMASNPALLDDDSIEDALDGEDDDDIEDIDDDEFDDSELDDAFDPKDDDGKTIH